MSTGKPVHKDLDELYLGHQECYVDEKVHYCRQQILEHLLLTKGNEKDIAPTQVRISCYLLLFAEIYIIGQSLILSICKTESKQAYQGECDLLYQVGMLPLLQRIYRLTTTATGSSNA